MNMVLVFMVCQCNMYVIPKSICRKGLGYKWFPKTSVWRIRMQLTRSRVFPPGWTRLRAGRSSRRMDLAAAAAGDRVTRMSLSRAGRSSWRTWAGATSSYAD